MFRFDLLSHVFEYKVITFQITLNDPPMSGGDIVELFGVLIEKKKQNERM